jgi:hypothetical protein
MGSMVLPNPFLPMQKPVSVVFKTSFPKMTFGLSATKSINHSWWSKITEIAKLVFKTRKPVSAVSKTGFLMPAFGFQAPQSDLQRSENHSTARKCTPGLVKRHGSFRQCGSGARLGPVMRAGGGWPGHRSTLPLAEGTRPGMPIPRPRHSGGFQQAHPAYEHVK